MSAKVPEPPSKLSQVVPDDAALDSGLAARAGDALVAGGSGQAPASAWNGDLAEGPAAPPKAGADSKPVAVVSDASLAPPGLEGDAWLPGQQWIQKGRLLEHLAAQRRPLWHLLPLPLALLGFAALASWVVLHLRLSMVYGLSSAVGRSLWPDSAQALNLGGSVWTWLNSKSEVRLVAPHTPIVAGIRLTRMPTGQRAAPWVLCEYSAWSFLWDAIGAGGAPGEVVSPTVCQNRSSDTVWLPWALRNESAGAEVQAARSAWYGASPAAAVPGLQVSLLAHNQASNFYVLSELTLELDPSGLPMNRTALAAFDAEPAWLNVIEDWNAGRWPLLILDAGFISLVLFMLIVRVVEACRHCCVGRCRKRAQLSVWAVVDWAIICTAFPTVVLYAYCNCLVTSLKELVQALPAVGDQQRYTHAELDAALASSSSTFGGYTQQLDIVLDQAQRLAGAQFELLCCVGVIGICACLRFGSGLGANPRLETFVSSLFACHELVYPVIVFGIFALAFALTGHMIFGGRIETFSSIGGSLVSLVFFLAGNAFDPLYEQMHAVGGAIGVAWDVLLGVVVCLLLLSWILVVVIDGYIGARARAGDAPSVLRQARSALAPRRLQAEQLRALAEEVDPCGGTRDEERQRRREIWEAVSKYGDRQVLESLSKTDAHPAPLVSSSSLARALGAETWAAQLQLDGILKRALKQELSSKAAEANSLNEAIRLMARIDANVRDLDVNIKPAASYLEAAQRREDLGRAASKELLTAAAAGGASQPQDNESGVYWMGYPEGGDGWASEASMRGKGGLRAALGLGDVFSVDSDPGSRSSHASTPPPSCTDDFECEDLSPPPSPPPEEEDLDPVAPMWAAELEDLDLVASASAAELPAPPSGSLEPAPTSSRAASPHVEKVAVLENLLPPSPTPPPAPSSGMQLMADRLEELELAGQKRCGNLREYCANLECSLAAAAERMEATVGFQAEALSNIESALDQLIHGVGPLFAPS